jgi:tetratricopeptide (TPR) repeat protein
MRQIENKLIVLLVIALYLCLRAQAEPSTRPRNASISQERKSALWWLTQASQEAAAINPWDGRKKAYWLLSRAQVNAGDFDGARRSLREWSRSANYMQVYLQEATACYKLGNQRGYRASMNKAIHLAPKNLFTRDIIEVYLDCQDPNGATRYADSLTLLEGKRKAYQEIACYWACLGKTDQMNTLLATRFEPSYREYVIVNIIEVSALKGRFSVAEELLREISEEVYQQCARRALCEAYAQAGNITKAEDIAKTIVEYSNVNSSSIISDMSESYSDAENVATSRILVAVMSELDNRSLALTAIARAYVKANNMERAKNLLKEVPRDYQESIYEAMIAQQVAKGQIDAAQDSIEALVRITQDDPFKWGPTKHYLDIARAAAKQGDMLNYHSFINRAIAGAEELWDLERWYSWSRIFIIQCEVGDVKGLLYIAETNEDEAVRSGALSMAVRKFSQDGDISKAKMHAKQITSDGKPIAYAAVSSALVRADRMTEAQAFLETLTDNQERAEAYRCAALWVVNMGRQDVLIDWLKPINCPVVRFNVCLGAAQAFDEDYKKFGKTRDSHLFMYCVSTQKR